MSRNCAIIGDIHGDAERLRWLLSSLPRDDRHLIFVGDYVNRGADSKGVLEVLRALKAELGDRCSLLAGNHELALLRYLRQNTFAEFATLGGLFTIRSYIPSPRGNVHEAFLNAFPPEHLTFLSSLETHYEDAELLVSHTGYDPRAPEDRSLQQMAEQAHAEMFTNARGPKPLVVCGHYVQRAGRPLVLPGLVIVDTGCGTLGGPLTALLYPEQDFISTP